jgi:hypothetical protein
MGVQGSPQQIALLREKWPLAFPVKHQDVRPLAAAAREIAAAMDWPLSYALGVLKAWKMAPVYSEASFVMTNASPSTARRPKRLTPRAGIWRPSGLRRLQRARGRSM